MSLDIQKIEEQLPDRAVIKELAVRIKKFMPGGNRLTEDQALSGAQIVLNRGLDPFRDAYVYPDNRGNIVVKEKYTVSIKWAQKVSPYNRRFARIIDTASKEEGLDNNDVAYYCYLMRRDKLPELSELTQAGYPADVALQMVEVRGIGVVTAKEAGKREPPQGWTWARVAQKRAEADAIRLAYGEPSPEELQAMRYNVDVLEVTEADYDGTETLAPGDARELAKFRAQQRTPVLTDEQLPDAQYALYGDVVEAEYSAIDDGPDFEDGSEQQPTTRYSPEKLKQAIAKSVAAWRAEDFTFGDKARNFRSAVVTNLESCFGQHADQCRHLVTEYLTGKASSKDLDDAEIKVLHTWLDAHPIDGGAWVVNQFSQQEAHAVYKQALEDKGQMNFLDADEYANGLGADLVDLPVYEDMTDKELQDHVHAVLWPLVTERGLHIDGFSGSRPTIEWLAIVWAALEIKPTIKICTVQ